MSQGTRTPRPDVQAILHIQIGGIERMGNQCFYTTDKGWELWQETPMLRRLKYWRQSSIIGELAVESK